MKLTNYRKSDGCWNCFYSRMDYHDYHDHLDCLNGEYGECIKDIRDVEPQEGFGSLMPNYIKEGYICDLYERKKDENT